MIRKVSFVTLLLLTTLLLNAERRIRVACVGNSVTAGYLLPEPKSQSYPSVLQRLLGDQYEVGNFGHSGATLLEKGHRPYVKTEEYQRAKAFDADIIIIHLGLNDTDPRNWANYSSEFLPDYLRLIDSLRHGDQRKRVLIAQMSPITAGHPRFDSSTRDWYQKVNAEIARVAQLSGHELINYSTPLEDYPHLLPDYLHPNVEGAERLARYAYSCLTGDWGGLSLAPYYQSGMLLQRNRLNLISGRANAHEEVRLSVGGRSYKTKADRLGDWQLTIDSLSTAHEHKLTIKTKAKTIQLDRVIVGDLWLASGQSNMSWMLGQTKDFAPEQALSDDRLRMYTMYPIAETYKVAWPITVLDSINALDYYKPGTWMSAQKPSELSRQSAVAYHFLRTLRDSLPDIPQAVIVNAIGGSPLESWVSQRSLEESLPASFINWTKKDYAQPWVRERANDNIALRPQAQRHPYENGYLYAAGIKPLRGFALRGIIWYQGESNAHNGNLYSKLFRLFVKDMRSTLTLAKGKRLPIYTVQLSSISNRPSWSEFRLTQSSLTGDARQARQIIRTYTVPSYDRGDSLDVHPRYKQPIGERLARYALLNEYGHKGAYQHTIGLELKRSSDKRRLVITAPKGGAVHPASGDKVYGFELLTPEGTVRSVVFTRGDDGLYTADVSLEDFVSYRYAYQPYTEGNLVNELGIPVMPCRGPLHL